MSLPESCENCKKVYNSEEFEEYYTLSSERIAEGEVKIINCVFCSDECFKGFGNLAVKRFYCTNSNTPLDNELYDTNKNFSIEFNEKNYAFVLGHIFAMSYFNINRLLNYTKEKEYIKPITTEDILVDKFFLRILDKVKIYVPK